MKKITIDYIAKELGYSKGLVSLALNNKPGVNENTRTKIVMEAVRMGYDFKDRNVVRTGKKVKKKVFVCFHRYLLDDRNYWMDLVYLVEQNLQRLNCTMQLHSINRKDQIELLPVDFYRSGCDGFIGFGSEIPNSIILQLRDMGKPVILIDSGCLLEGITKIKASNYLGAYWMTKYLHDMGHRHICVAGESKGEETFAERRSGIERFAFHKNDIRLDFVDDRPVEGPTPVNADRLRDYLRSGDRATAFMCINDAVAVKLYEIAEESGFVIPDDFSVVGFDNVERCEWVRPKLTTCAVNKERMAETAVLMLINLMQNEAIYEGIKIEIPTKIICRDSVKPIEP